MLDPLARRWTARPLERAAGRLDLPWVTPDRITVAGIVLGLGAAVLAGLAAWPAALVLWLLSRVADGLDGTLARRRRRTGAAPDTGAGGFLDITGDFLVYGSGVVGVGVGAGGSLLPFLLVLLAYYVNGAAFLAFSSIAERTGQQLDDGRSLSFVGGLAGGTETVLVHAAWCVLPFWAEQLAWAWAAVVAVSAGQRVVGGYRTLQAGPAGSAPAAPRTGRR